jgi:hypothetical protein
VAREFTGGEDCAAQLAGQLLDAGGTVDGWTNASEIKSIAAADIAVEDIADSARPDRREARGFSPATAEFCSSRASAAVSSSDRSGLIIS